MATAYSTDVIAWANEQAALLRAGNFGALDIEHIADEVEDVGKSERRELMSRMVVLLVHLLKWRFQPERRGASWQTTVRHQRRLIDLDLQETPSLKVSLADAAWQEKAWLAAVGQASSVTNMGEDIFPEICPWTTDQILDQAFLPD